MHVRAQCGLSQPFQNQISFQQSDDSEAKRSSDITEIIINVRHTHTHTHTHTHMNMCQISEKRLKL